jgi:acetyl esterase/lipase
MRTSGSILLILSLILSITPVVAQPLVIRIWPNGAPGEIRNSAYREDTVYTEKHEPRIRHVTDPELYLYAASGRARTAVIICPGGSYGRLSMEHEGRDIARWLNGLGVTGIVLKYRLPSDTIMMSKSIAPLQDAQEAIRIVRRRAGEWDIDPARIGVIGFSAGGHLAASLSTLYGFPAYHPPDTTSARPDFSLLIYPVISMQETVTHAGSRANLLGPHPDSSIIDLFSTDLHVDKFTPPAFLVHALDDHSVPAANSIRYAEALCRSGVPAEIHLYERGGHGFGLARQGGTESEWTNACKAWMRSHQLIP